MSKKYLGKVKKMKKKREIINKLTGSEGLSKYIEDNTSKQEKMTYIKGLARLKKSGDLDFEITIMKNHFSVIVAPLTKFGLSEFKKLRNSLDFPPEKYKTQSLKEANEVMNVFGKRNLEGL